MTIQKRSLIILYIIVLLSMLYGVAKYKSTYLVEFIVERTLIQKAPSGTDPARVRDRLRVLIEGMPDRKSKTDLLFRIAGELEKVQALTLQGISQILQVEDPRMLMR
jgi:hypothetical protein